MPKHGPRDAAVVERAQIVQRGHAARREHRPRRGLGHVFHERQIGALHLALEVHGGHEHAGQRHAAAPRRRHHVEA
jgi:hypothetical protein